MTPLTQMEPPRELYEAAAFAHSLVKLAENECRNTTDLFVALAGLVASRDQALAADCLLALDSALAQ